MARLEPVRSTSAIERNPQIVMAVGALAVSTSAVLIGLSGASPGTASFYRCALSLPLLGALATWELRSGGPLRRRDARIALIAGLLFAGDMLLWTQAIAEIGAGLSTVLVNAQVLIVPLLALGIDREPVGGRFIAAFPVVCVGVVLAGGVLEAGVAGSRPVAGTVHAVLAAVCYSGFLFLLRRGGQGGGRTVQSYLVVTGSAALASLLIGALWHGVNLVPAWATIGWLALVAVCGQVLGWLLVALASPRLPSNVGAILLLLTPAGAVVLGAVVLGERPSLLQLLGCALILAGAYAVAVRRS